MNKEECNCPLAHACDVWEKELPSPTAGLAWLVGVRAYQAEPPASVRITSHVEYRNNKNCEFYTIVRAGIDVE